MVHHELLHLNIVIFAEQLQESESTAQGKFIVELSLNLEFISLMAEHFDQDVFLAVEMIIGIYYFIGEHSLLFIFFEFADLNQEVTNVFDQLFQAEEGSIGGIASQFGQNGVLAVGVTIEQVHNTKKEGFIEKFGFSE